MKSTVPEILELESCLRAEKQFLINSFEENLIRIKSEFEAELIKLQQQSEKTFSETLIQSEKKFNTETELFRKELLQKINVSFNPSQKTLAIISESIVKKVFGHD